MVHHQALIYTHLHRGLARHGYLLALACGLLVAGAASGLADSLADQQSQLEQQLAALMSAASSPNQQQQAISTASSHAPTTSTAAEQPGTGSRSRSPRSIGDMFKKLFNANKRSKSQQSNSREWDQLQQQAAFQNQQQQAAAFQNQMVASSLAAAAANQHAVYASPFATYASSYSPYSGAGLIAWPSSSLAQALRAGTPTLLGPAGSTVSLASPSAAAAAAGSLYAAASQPYTAYAAPPPGIGGPQPQVGPVGSGLVSLGQQQQQQPMVAASHQHVSAVPPPPSHHQSAQTGSLDFHQVLDALVRTSGFAPAGDQEAAAAQNYAAKEGTPVFSFKKLVSLPFYLSSDEKSLDTLAPAAHPGYSLHSMPIMRRHVRRMSSPTTHHLNHHLNHQLQLGSLAGASFQTDPSARSEREQQLRYSSYFNALNNQLASMTANNQLMQYLTRQQNQPSIASQVEAFAADAALANYQASQQPFKSSGRSSGAPHQQQQMAMAASTVVPMAVAAPQSLLGPPKEAGEREFQALLSSIQIQNPNSPASSVAVAGAIDNGPYYAGSGSSYTPASTDSGNRYGAQSVAPQYYWPRESVTTVQAGNGANVLNQRDYLSLFGSSASMQQPSNLLAVSGGQQQVAQNNAMLLQEQQQQQQHQQNLQLQQQQQSMVVGASGITQSQMQPAQQTQQVVDQQQQQQQSVSVSQLQQQPQSAMNTQSQQQQQQQSLVPQGTLRDGTGAASSSGFTQTSAQIEGQQK